MNLQIQYPAPLRSLRLRILSILCILSKNLWIKNSASSCLCCSKSAQSPSKHQNQKFRLIPQLLPIQLFFAPFSPSPNPRKSKLPQVCEPQRLSQTRFPGAAPAIVQTFPIDGATIDVAFFLPNK